MVLFPFHWATQFKYLLVAFPRSELLGRFCRSPGAPPGLAVLQRGGAGAALLRGEALPKSSTRVLLGSLGREHVRVTAFRFINGELLV